MLKKSFFISILFLALLLVNVGCTDNKEVTSLVATKNEVTLYLNEQLDINSIIEKEGKGKLYYAIENPEVISIDGSVVAAKAEGKGVVTVTGGDKYLRITVNVIDQYKISLLVKNTECDYDGQVHFPSLDRTSFPSGTKVDYYVDGQIFSGATKAGKYNVTVRLELPSPYYTNVIKDTAILTIHKKTVDLSAVRFVGRTYTYDGEEKSVMLEGSLPEYVKVTYINNKATDAGTYRARAEFDIEDKENYVVPSPLTATLTISKKFINISNIGFSSAKIKYDGERHGIRVDESHLPEGIDVFYYNDDGSLQKDYTFVDSGSYPVYLKLSCLPEIYKNHAFVFLDEVVTFEFADDKYVSNSTVSAILTVEKASFSMQYVWKMLDENDKEVSSFIYGEQFGVGTTTGKRIVLEGNSCGVRGEYPQGLEVRLTTNTVTNPQGNVLAGSYSVYADFVLPSGAQKNYTVPERMIYNYKVDKGTFDISFVSFTYPLSTIEYAVGVSYDDMAITVPTEKEELFSENVTVEYTYRLNGINMGNYEDGSVLHAGVYVVQANFTLTKEDKLQYNDLPSKTIDFVITPKEISFEVVFEDVTTTFDGEIHTVSFSTLPADIGVKFTCEKNTYQDEFTYRNAGTYPLCADFTYKNWAQCDYALLINGRKTYSLVSTVTVKKKAQGEVDTSSYTQQEDLTYSSTLLLKDIVIADNEDGYVRWKNENDRIKVTSYDEKTHIGTLSASALYNTDIQNYEDYEFKIEITIALAKISLSGMEFRSQFIPYTGKEVVPVLQEETPYKDQINICVTADDLVSLGKHTCEINLSAKEPNHYYIDGNTTFNNVAIYIYDGALFKYKQGTTTLVSYVGGQDEVTVPDGTTAIAKNCFETCEQVFSLVLPNSIESLINGSLYGLTRLKTITLPSLYYADGANSLRMMFNNFLPAEIETVTVTKDMTVSDRAFSQMKCLTTVVYENRVTTVGMCAFEYCTALQRVDFGGVPSDIGENAFIACTSLIDLTVDYLGGAGSTEGFSYLFGSNNGAGGMNDYSKYTLSLTVLKQTSFPNSAFAGVSGAKEFVFSSSAIFGENCFSACTAKVDLTNSSLTSISSHVFASSSLLLTLPKNVETISSYAFYNNSSSEIVLPKSVTAINNNAFNGCTAKVVFAENSTITQLGNSAFYRYDGKEISLPASLQTIGQSAFEESSIESITLVEGTTIGQCAFRNCKKLVSASIECAVVAEYAFYGCENLKVLSLGENVTVIERYAFDDCSMLEEIELGENITSIGAYAFYNCALLKTVTMRMPTPPAPNEGVFLSETGGNKIIFYVPGEGYMAYYNGYFYDTVANMDKCEIKTKQNIGGKK